MQSGIPSSGFRRGSLLSGPKSDQRRELRFVYLLLLSVALHAVVAVLMALWPVAQQPPLSEPVFVDLQEMKDLQMPSPQLARPSDQQRRTLKEAAPKPLPVPVPSRQSAPSPSIPLQAAQRPAAPPQAGRSESAAQVGTRAPEAVGSAGELVRRRVVRQPAQASASPRLQPNLLPNAGRMARIEESYRRRFADDLDDGSTRFLNTDDIQFGSFLRRFETAVYGVWRYPQEAALKGIEGMTPVKITFNRQGEIIRVTLLESSGSKILDDEVFRTLRMLGPMGGFPRSYQKDEFHLVAFFHYGLSGGRLH